MTNPLTTLDELIWRQFEKVTVAAEKRWGWDKWDLAGRTWDVAMTCLVGNGIYTTIYGINRDYDAPLALGLFCIGITPLASYSYSWAMLRFRKKELADFIKTEAARKAEFNPSRPLHLASGYSLTGLGTSMLLLEVPYFEEFLQYSDSRFLVGSALVTAGIGITSIVCSNYFVTQPPRPPSSAKKSLWQALADYITKPFHKEPQPGEVPVAKYNVEQRAVVACPPIPGGIY